MSSRVTRSKCCPSASAPFSLLNCVTRGAPPASTRRRGRVGVAVGDGDEQSAWSQHPPHLREPAVQVGHVVEHPQGHDHVELRVAERQLLHIRRQRPHASRGGQLHEPRGPVGRHHRGPRVLSHHPVREHACPATDFEHRTGRRTSDCLRGGVLGVTSVGRVPPHRAPGVQPALGDVLPGDLGGIHRLLHDGDATNPSPGNRADRPRRSSACRARVGEDGRPSCPVSARR